jgi:hypothetical protein
VNDIRRVKREAYREREQIDTALNQLQRSTSQYRTNSPFADKVNETGIVRQSMPPETGSVQMVSD